MLIYYSFKPDAFGEKSSRIFIARALAILSHQDVNADVHLEKLSDDIDDDKLWQLLPYNYKKSHE